MSELIPLRTKFELRKSNFITPIKRQLQYITCPLMLLCIVLHVTWKRPRHDITYFTHPQSNHTTRFMAFAPNEQQPNSSCSIRHWWCDVLDWGRSGCEYRGLGSCGCQYRGRGRSRSGCQCVMQSVVMVVRCYWLHATNKSNTTDRLLTGEYSRSHSSTCYCSQPQLYMLLFPTTALCYMLLLPTTALHVTVPNHSTERGSCLEHGWCFHYRKRFFCIFEGHFFA